MKATPPPSRARSRHFSTCSRTALSGETPTKAVATISCCSAPSSREDRCRCCAGEAGTARVCAHAPVAPRDRHEQRGRSVFDLCWPQAGSRPWLRDAAINRDRNLRLQYLAGLGLNLYQADQIYADMLRYVTKMPDDLFVAKEETKQALWAGINRQQGR